MQTTSRSSRRSFVLGGAAVAACAGPLAQAGIARAAAPARSEVGEWERLVGGRFLVGGEGGGAVATLAAIERPAFDPARPAALARRQPFTARFEMAAHRAPVGQRTYALAHPGGGTIALFLGRGEDRHGKAVLLALFN